MKKTIIIGTIALSLVGFSNAIARPSVDELDEYSKTGESENCVHIRNIRSTRVLDDRHILFFMTGGKTYVNKLPNRCSRLGFERSFSYSVSGSQLCNVDIITVIDDGTRGISCGLGMFEELEKKEKEDG